MISLFANNGTRAKVSTYAHRTIIVVFLPDGCSFTIDNGRLPLEECVDSHGRACERAKDMIGLPSLRHVLEAT